MMVRTSPASVGRAGSVDGARSRPQRPKVDSRKHQFIAAGGDEALHLAQDGFGGQAARRAARLRNDAECAAIAAAFLDLQVGAGLRAGNDLRFFKKGVSEAVVGQHHLRWGQFGLRRLNIVVSADGLR